MKRQTLWGNEIDLFSLSVLISLLSSHNWPVLLQFFKYSTSPFLWSWSYGSWINNYLCNQCLSPLKLWVRTPFMARCTRYNIISLCDKVSIWKTNKTGLGFMVFNTTFNNISVISWRSVLLVEETRVPWENHRPVASHLVIMSVKNRDPVFQKLTAYSWEELWC
jgi:hypothetical protein